jgi:hypothetical protein
MELEQFQIQKQKLGRSTWLSYYCFSLALLISFSSLNSFQVINWMAFLFTLPVSIYFFVAVVKQTIAKRQFVKKFAPELISAQQQKAINYNHFSFKQFLFQPNWAFRVNLLLLLLVVFTMISIHHQPVTSLGYVN